MDHHEDATDTRGSTKGAETCASDAVHGAEEEGDEQVEAVEAEEPGEDSDEGGDGVRADARMEAIATEKGKEIACVEDDEGEGCEALPRVVDLGGLAIRPSVEPVHDGELQGEALLGVHEERTFLVGPVSWHDLHWVEPCRRRSGVDARLRASLPEAMPMPLISDVKVPRLRSNISPIEGGLPRKGITP